MMLIKRLCDVTYEAAGYFEMVKTVSKLFQHSEPVEIKHSHSATGCFYKAVKIKPSSDLVTLQMFLALLDFIKDRITLDVNIVKYKKNIMMMILFSPLHLVLCAINSIFFSTKS